MVISMFPQKAILFDLGGVLLQEPERNLFDQDIRIFNRMFEFIKHVHGVDEKRNWFLGNTSSEQLVEIVRAHIDDRQHFVFFKSEAERLMIKHGCEYILLPQHLTNFTSLNAEGFEFLKKCREKGIRIMILSNWDPASYVLIVKKFPELFDLFDEADIFIPTKTGFMKPESGCFAHIALVTQLNLQDIIFIDDSATNAQAGIHAGLQAIHHTGWAETVEHIERLRN